MQTRWWIVVMLGCGVSTPSKIDTPGNATETVVPTATQALVEGYVRDGRTGTTVPGVQVDAWLGPRDDGRLGAWAISDERGFFRLDVEPGTGFLLVHPEDGDGAPSLTFLAGARIRIDLTVDPNELAEWRALYPPEACPSSPPGTIIEGHTTTQQDLDDIARTVLERSAVEPHAIPDLGIAAQGGAPIAVRADVGPRKQLSARALPSRGFVLRTRAAMQAEADRFDRDVGYIELSRVYSNGTCAVLRVGGDFITPSTSRSTKLCCCAGRDIYEKRGSRWQFVRRVSESCG